MVFNTTINVDHFNTYLYLFIGDKKEVLDKIRKNFKNIDIKDLAERIGSSVGTYLPLVDANGAESNLIIITDYDKKYIDKIINHEIVHFVFHLAKYVGITLNDGSEEFFAYYIGYYTDLIKKLYNKKLRKK